ncbi:MAG TPA: hypothetical protein VGH42_11300 [Verrucomicrobiae bacterium]|jgi:hypothetical protein
MLIRISLIVAVIAALAAGVLNFAAVKDKITTLTTDRNTQRDGRISAENERDKTKKDLAKTQGDLKQTQGQLADANSARDKAVATATAQTKRADDLNVQLTKTIADRDDAQTKLAAYVATGVSADQVGALNKSLKDEQDALAVSVQEKIVLMRTITRLTNELVQFTGTGEYVVRLPANLKGKILVVDPKWNFVVLNVGEDQGAIQDGELLVSRDGKLVAKVIIRSVEKDRSIANIIPGWQLGEVIEGDEVTPAHPAS